MLAPKSRYGKLLIRGEIPPVMLASIIAFWTVGKRKALETKTQIKAKNFVIFVSTPP